MSKYVHVHCIVLNYYCLNTLVPDTTDNCTNGVIRLVKGETEYEGLVEICADGSWGYICPHSWRETEAMTTCRQLGYTTIGQYCIAF